MKRYIKILLKTSLKTPLLILLGTIFGALIFSFLSAGDVYEYQDTVDGVHLPEVDAIVCLAGGRGRIAAAGDIWYRYWELSQSPLPGMGRTPVPRKIPILYLSGMGYHSTFPVLTHQVRRGVLEVLKPRHVVIENESSNTEENALWLMKEAKKRGWEKILLMTSRYHMKRAKFIFDSLLKNQIPSLKIETLSVYQEPFEPGEWRSSFHGIRVTVIEYLKWIYFKVWQK